MRKDRLRVENRFGQPLRLQPGISQSIDSTGHKEHSEGVSQNSSSRNKTLVKGKVQEQTCFDAIMSSSLEYPASSPEALLLSAYVLPYSDNVSFSENQTVRSSASNFTKECI